MVGIGLEANRCWILIEMAPRNIDLGLMCKAALTCMIYILQRRGCIAKFVRLRHAYMVWHDNGRISIATKVGPIVIRRHCRVDFGATCLFSLQLHAIYRPKKSLSKNDIIASLSTFQIFHSDKYVHMGH